MSLLEVSNLTVSYPGCPAAVHELSFSVEAGEAMGIVGESGAGKSQTALAIMGLLPANAQVSGSIIVSGTDITDANSATMRKLRAQKMSMVFQDPATALNPYLRVGNQLRRILLEHKLVTKREAKSRCVEMLDRVGLHDPERQYHAYPHQLSGGMRQRALIAAALIGEPDLIIADEPTTALDVTVQAKILKLLESIRNDLQTALLMITHDLGVISSSCDRMMVMDNGCLIEEGACNDVLANPQQTHTRRLVAAVPNINSPVSPRDGINDAETLMLADKVTVSFRERRRGSRSQFKAVESVSFDLKAGETIAIVGESGSGKTSLARSVAGLLPGKAGSVSFLGAVLPWQVEHRSRETRRKLQMVFQDPVSSLSPAMRVGRIIAEPLLVHHRSRNASELREAVVDMLNRVGLDQSLAERFPHELSGGQAQRVAIARALILEPVVLICDEALAALDGTVRKEIIGLLKSEREKTGLSLILITHDLGVVHEISDRVIVMHQGEICETASNEQLFSNPQHEYTKELLAAVPSI